jgi:hypothetical protein
MANLRDFEGEFNCQVISLDNDADLYKFDVRFLIRWSACLASLASLGFGFSGFLSILPELIIYDVEQFISEEIAPRRALLCEQGAESIQSKDVQAALLP